MKKLRISSSFNLHTQPTDDLIKNVQYGLDFMERCGFEALDFTANILKSLDERYEQIIDSILEDTARRKIKFELCHLPFDPKLNAYPERIIPFNSVMHRAIDAAAKLGVKYAVMHPNTTTLPLADFDSKLCFNSVISHLAPFVEHAERVGLRVVVENMCVIHEKYPTHRYCQTPEELAEVADKLGIGVCWDFGHGHIGGLRQSEALHYLASRVKVLHVNDNMGYGDDHLPPFIGTIDWQDAMTELSKIGFDGLFNYEIAAQRVPADAKESFARYLVSAAKELLTYL